MISVVGRVRSRLGGQPSSLVVPWRSTGSAEYAATHRDARWTVVHPAEHVVRQPPVRYGTRPSRLQERVVERFPDLGVLQLQDGYVAGRYGWIVSSDRHLLPDHAWHGEGVRRRRAQEAGGRILEVVHLRGSALSLATYAGGANYAHFVLDSLPRIHLAEAAGAGPGTVDHVIANVINPGTRDLLRRLGVPPDRIVEPCDGVALRVDRLVAPTFPGVRRNYPPWVARYLHDGLAPAGATGDRRLYIPRLQARRIRNIDEVMPVLRERGFETFDPATHPDPFAVFAEARAVVAVHGAALAALAACPPGAAVLELLPSEHQVPYYYTLADSAGLHYGHLVVDSLPDQPDVRPDKVDVHVPPDELAAALDGTLERAGLV